MKWKFVVKVNRLNDCLFHITLRPRGKKRIGRNGSNGTFFCASQSLHWTTPHFSIDNLIEYSPPKLFHESEQSIRKKSGKGNVNFNSIDRPVILKDYILNSTFVFVAGRTISWALLTPSLSPYKRSVQVGQESFSTNPAVRLYRYDRDSGEVRECKTNTTD